MILQRIDKILAGLPENARLRSEIDELREEMALLEEENSVLKAKVSDLQSKLEAIEKNEEIGDEAYQILEALFNNGPCADLPRLAASFHLQEGEVEYHLDELRRRNFIEKKPVVYGGGGTRPVTACLLPAGRAFVMNQRSKK